MTLQGRMLGGRYALGAMLGAGGMGQVYRARDRVLQRTVAVKVLGHHPYDQDPAMVARFVHEARVAAGLSHPNIVSIFDTGSEGGLHYLVMEYVEGESLAELLRREGVLAPPRAAEIGRAVCQALAAAHARGLVHRDITPGNVLVSNAGIVKVTDFGIAKLLAGPTLTASGMLLGTATYLSPEQAQGQPVDPRSDLYGLGCVLYELLTGAPPFAGDNPVAVAAQHVTQQPIPPSQRNPAVGPGLEMVVLTALAKRPADRYQSATTMAQDLERVAGHHTAAAVPPAAGTADPTVTVPTAVAPRPPTLAMPPLDVARRLGWIRWVLAGGLGVVAVLVVALWPRGDNPPTGPRSTGPAALTAAPTTAPAPSPRPQVGLTLALATLTEALTSGQQQGLVDPAAQDLLKQAQEATRAVKKGKADEQQKKLQDLERKTDELIEKGKIRGPAAGKVRQAIAQLSSAAQRSE
jgi:eukaryotic-like serine/threonine-protein kinase